MIARLRVGLIGLLLLISGCGGSGSTAPAPPPPPTIGQLYVAKAQSNSILVFKAGDNGNVAPQRTITVPDEPSQLSLDVAHDRLVTFTNDILHSVVLFDNVSNPACCVNPRVINGAATTLHFAGGVALDGTADLVYVFDAPKILVFGPASSVTGNVAPLRTVTPPFAPGGIAVDAATNRLFVSDDTNNAVAVYDNASTISGSAAPSRVITGAATQISLPGVLALDSTGRLLVNNARTGTLLVFNNAGRAAGNVAPSQVITLPVGAAQVAVTSAGDLYEVDFLPEVRAFANVFSAGGPMQVRMITGPNTTLDSINPGAPPIIGGVALDPTR